MVVLVPKKVLTRVPFQLGRLAGGSRHVEVKNRVAHKVPLRALFELVLIIGEADSALVSSIPTDSLALAVVRLVQRAEPIEVHDQHLE